MFLCYWGIDDVLTQATALSHLKVLEQNSDVQEITFVTIERDKAIVARERMMGENKIVHFSLTDINKGFNLLTKIADFIYLPAQIAAICTKRKIDLIFAHGAPAGALAYKAGKKYECPMYVNLFEPHADYMKESKVWGKYSLKYFFQSYWEKMQKKLAVGLMPVAENYREQLIREGVLPEKIFTVPCAVNATDFKYNSDYRNEIRNNLNWNKLTIGIYVGKFGDLYYDHEAFQTYKKCFDLFPGFRLIILTPQFHERILQRLREHEIDLGKIHIVTVRHEKVPAYLSAADFAFATYKPGPSKKYLSPVKIGEYWANGLPVLLTEGVGDDSDIIKNEGGGALFNLQEEGSLERAIEKIQKIIKDPAHRQEIPRLAIKYRSPEKIKEAYEYFFRNMAGNS